MGHAQKVCEEVLEPKVDWPAAGGMRGGGGETDGGRVPIMESVTDRRTDERLPLRIEMGRRLVVLSPALVGGSRFRRERCPGGAGGVSTEARPISHIRPVKGARRNGGL